eukprot:GHVL01031603.1.p1 GENE.GHVL01031603.1~~GHVL01031603.1.p1  ORF type:complete len:167 (+),score=22.86 GHVL01031603.1:746-1246(+)
MFARAICRSVSAKLAVNSKVLVSSSIRTFATAASNKLKETLGAEFEHEKSVYEHPAKCESFLKSSSWTLEKKEGDVNMVLTRQLADGKKVVVEYQLTAPYNPDMEGEEQEGMDSPATDFSVTVENPKDSSGVVFYCSTQSGGDHRVSNVCSKILNNVVCDWKHPFI